MVAATGFRARPVGREVRFMVNLRWRSEIRPVSRFRILVASAVLGVLVAVGAIAFLAACEVVTRVALTQGAGYQPGGPAGETVLVFSAVGGSPRVWLLVPIAMLGGLVTGWVTRRFAPEAAGSGSDTAIHEYYDACGRVHLRVAVVKILATALTIGTGGSGGREGPMIQVGAGVGSWLGGRFGFGTAGRRVLLAAGMGAGVAAVFRSPLGGTLFAAEVLNRSEEIESEVLIPAGTAAVTATWRRPALFSVGDPCFRPTLRRSRLRSTSLPTPCLRSLWSFSLGCTCCFTTECAVGLPGSRFRWRSKVRSRQ